VPLGHVEQRLSASNSTSRSSGLKATRISERALSSTVEPSARRGALFAGSGSVNIALRAHQSTPPTAIATTAAAARGGAFVAFGVNPKLLLARPASR